jgi:titin
VHRVSGQNTNNNVVNITVNASYSQYSYRYYRWIEEAMVSGTQYVFNHFFGMFDESGNQLTSDTSYTYSSGSGDFNVGGNSSTTFALDFDANLGGSPSGTYNWQDSNNYIATGIYTGSTSMTVYDPTMPLGGGNPTAPTAPTSLSATLGSGNVSISFTQGSDGGSAITNYKYSLNGGTFTAFDPADTTSPVVIGGLSSGISYSIQLKAVNSIGDSDASATVSPPPNTIGALGETVSFDLGAAYQLGSYGYCAGSYPNSLQPNVWKLAGSNDNSTWYLVDSVSNGNSGSGDARSFTPSGPSNVSAFRYYRWILQALTSGGSCYMGGFFLKNTSGAVITASVIQNNIVSTYHGGGFANFAYWINRTSFGGGNEDILPHYSPTYSGSNSTTLITDILPSAPPAPTSLGTLSGNGNVSIFFTQGSDGGSAITNYKYSLNGGTFTALSPADTTSPVVIGGLTNGVSYSTQLKGVNYFGDGTASASVTVTPPIPQTAAGAWMQLQLPSSTVITKYRLAPVAFGSEYRPTLILLVASTDGTNWVKLDQRNPETSIDVNGPGLHKTYNISNTTSYSYYRIILMRGSVYGYALISSFYLSDSSNTNYPPGLLATSTSDGYTLTSSPDLRVAINNSVQSTFGLPWNNLTENIANPNSINSGQNDGGHTYSNSSPYIYNGSVTTAYSIPPSAPPAPTSLVASAGIGNVSISFTQGSDGGSAISNYKYSLNGGIFTAFDPADTTSPVVIGGLTGGVSYNIQLKGVNYLGDGDASASIAVTPPIPQTANGAWLQMQLSTPRLIAKYSIKPYSGSVPINHLILGSNDGNTWILISSKTHSNTSWTTHDVPAGNQAVYSYVRMIIISGSPYYGMFGIDGFVVHDGSNIMYPPTLASPTDQGYITTNSSSWFPNGQGPTNWYYLSANKPDNNNPVWQTFLTGNYGSGSFGGSEITLYITPPSAPPAPTSLSASAGDQSASISFTQSSNGGDAITNYKYSLDGGSTFTAFSPADTTSPVVITGLTNGVSYNIQLKAVNSLGDGDASASITVTPSTIPDAPTNLVASYAGSGTVEISFTPGNDEGAIITNYQYSIDCGASFTALSPTDGTTPITITGLTNGQAYCIELKAVNSNGPGIASSSVQYTAYGPADAPTNITWVDTLNGTISVSFTPGSDQGSSITNYEYSLDGGSTFTALSPAHTTSPIPISGLNIRTHYSLALRAVNNAGVGESSATLNMYYMCFLEGTKILCFNPETQQEEYRAIETLRKGSLVKTVDDGYKAIDMIGTSKIYNPGNSVRSKNRLYKCSKENYPSLTEDLFITGCHSILVKDISEEERAELMDYQGKIYITDNHYRLIAAVDKRAEPHASEGVFNIWHMALENDNYYFNYGIYANGLLVETSSLRMMKEFSGMDLIQ